MLGLASVTWSWVSATALASWTTSIADFSEMVQSFLTRLMQKTASSAVNFAPLVKVALPVRSKV